MSNALNAFFLFHSHVSIYLLQIRKLKLKRIVVKLCLKYFTGVRNRVYDLNIFIVNYFRKYAMDFV